MAIAYRGGIEMKIFEQNEKMNFVDDNGVFVGFDCDQCCCESFGYEILHTVPDILNDQSLKDSIIGDHEKSESFLKFFNFDVDWKCKCKDELDTDGGGWEIFRLTNANKVEIFLLIYNYHNGYYAHGFNFGTPDRIISSGSI
jgi:hypothetical protein